MAKKQKILVTAGGLLFTLGIILSFLLSSVMIWGDLEASLFTSGLRPDKSLSTLRCPIIITASETGTITAELNNPTGKHLERYLIANISEGYASLVREIRTSLPIPPDNKEKVEWKIYPEDAAFEQRVILFRVYINPRYPHPSLGGNCGVVRVNINGVTGNQLFTSTTMLTLVCIGAGIVMLETGSRPTNRRLRNTLNNIYALAGILFATGVLGYLGMWVPGIGLLVTAVILLVIFITRRLASAT